MEDNEKIQAPDTSRYWEEELDRIDREANPAFRTSPDTPSLDISAPSQAALRGNAVTGQGVQPAPAQAPTLTDMFGVYRESLQKKKTDAQRRARYDALGRVVTNVFRPVAWGIAGSTAVVPKDDRTQYIKALDRADRIDDALDNLELQRANARYTEAQRLLQEDRSNREYDRRFAQQKAYQKEQAERTLAQQKELQNLKYEQEKALNEQKNAATMAYGQLMMSGKGSGRSGGGSGRVSQTPAADADTMYEANRIATLADAMEKAGQLTPRQQEMMNLLSAYKYSAKGLKEAKKRYPDEYEQILGWNAEAAEEQPEMPPSPRETRKAERQARRSARRGGDEVDAYSYVGIPDNRKDNRLPDPFAE